MSTSALDPLIHDPDRLRIVAALAALPDGDALTVTRLQDMIGLPPGSPICRSRELGTVGYVRTEITGGHRALASPACCGCRCSTPARCSAPASNWSPTPRSATGRMFLASRSGSSRGSKRARPRRPKAPTCAPSPTTAPSAWSVSSSPRRARTQATRCCQSRRQAPTPPPGHIPPRPAVLAQTGGLPTAPARRSLSREASDAAPTIGACDKSRSHT
jgi:hypothetical protein